MNEKDHILRLAIGAHRLNVPFTDFIEGLNLYVHDETAIDRQPLLGWWNWGGEPRDGRSGLSPFYGAILHFEGILKREQGMDEARTETLTKSTMDWQKFQAECPIISRIPILNRWAYRHFKQGYDDQKKGNRERWNLSS